MASNKRKFIDAPDAYETISFVSDEVSKLAALAYIQDTSVKETKIAKKIHNQEVRELQSSILNAINNVLKKWTNISGNGGNSYAMSRNRTEAKRKLALDTSSTQDDSTKWLLSIGQETS